jgi:hypothetical protein
MDKMSQQSAAKRAYEAPSVTRVFIDPIVDMLTACGDPYLQDGKTAPSICATVSS